MSWAGLLVAISAGIAAYAPHMDPHYTTILASIGAIISALGESILKSEGPAK
jgi:membrane protein DedA with SNARE-associated domain